MDEPTSMAAEASVNRSAVQQAMEDVLASEAFCNSLQSQKLLRYLLEHTLEKHDDLLRERAIGVEVFGKQPGYDTNDESIVRVRANELRKRLAKYYQSLPSPPPAVRFSLLPGSYRLDIQELPAAAATEPPPVAMEIVSVPEIAPAPPSANGTHHRRWTRTLAAAAILFALIGALAYKTLVPARTALDVFWGPAIDHVRPVVICIPHPVLYGISREFRTRVTGTSATHSQSLMDGLELDPNLPMKWRDIVTIRDQFVGVGTTYATAAISSYFAERHKPSTIRFGNDVSFEDFKNSPTVLVAAFSNRWTLDMTAGWRYVFADNNGVPVVKDRTTNQEWVLSTLQPNGRTQDDYAIISRVFQSQTGAFLISAAGITQYGTRSAGELLTNPVLLGRAVAGLPSDWARKNLQILIHVKIVGQVPAEPEIVATHQW